MSKKVRQANKTRNQLKKHIKRNPANRHLNFGMCSICGTSQTSIIVENTGIKTIGMVEGALLNDGADVILCDDCNEHFKPGGDFDYLTQKAINVNIYQQGGNITIETYRNLENDCQLWIEHLWMMTGLRGIKTHKLYN